MNQFLVLLDIQLQQISKKRQRLLRQRHTIVHTLIEMLKEKDFSYFTKETLNIILGSESSHTTRVVFEAFSIIMVLKNFYSIDYDTSY